MGRRIEYEDFEIEVSPCRHQELEVRVLRSPFDRPRAPFEPPYGPAETVKLLTNLEDQVCRSSEGLRDLVTELPEGAMADREDPKLVGQKLFEALFRDDIRQTLSSCGYVLYGDREARRGLRLRLSFGTASGDRAELAALPWELLCHPRAKNFLALDPRTPIVRYLDAARPTWSLRVKPPLRVLGVMPLPEGVERLDLENEWRLIETALEGSRVVLEVLKPPTTLEHFYNHLRGSEFPYHIVHFMGHGNFEDGRGVLLFENDAGHPSPVSGREVASQLGESLHSLRLMVVNACKGAKLNRRQGQDPFTSVAAELTLAGLPAVVAMQFPISDAAASSFSTAFYSALAEGRPVDAAVVEGRLAIQRRSPASLEWATPVLFLRGPDAQILDVADDEPDVPLRVGIMSSAVWDKEVAELSGNCDYFLNLTDAFQGDSIRDPALWQQEIGPKIEWFMTDAMRRDHPYVFEMRAHSSIAFTAGYYLELKKGTHLTVRQRAPHGMEDWRIDEGDVAEEPLWKLEEHALDAEGADSALPARKLLVATPADMFEKNRILSGAHAFRMAQILAQDIRSRKREGTLHLLISGPAAFCLYLGQCLRDCGPIQLYELDLGGPEAYTPSIPLGVTPASPDRLAPFGTSQKTEKSPKPWILIAVLILIATGLALLPGHLPLEPEADPIVNPKKQIRITSLADHTKEELSQSPQVPVMIALEGTAQNLDGSTIKIESQPREIESVDWTSRTEGIIIEAGLWKAHDVPVRDRYHNFYTGYNIRACTTGDPAFCSSAWHVIIKLPEISIEAINENSVEECSVKPNSSLHVRGTASYVLPNEKVRVAVLGKKDGTATGFWKISGYIKPDGSWDVDINIGEGRQFNIRAAVLSSEPSRSLFERMGSLTTCRVK